MQRIELVCLHISQISKVCTLHRIASFLSSDSHFFLNSFRGDILFSLAYSFDVFVSFKMCLTWHGFIINSDRLKESGFKQIVYFLKRHHNCVFFKKTPWAFCKGFCCRDTCIASYWALSGFMRVLQCDLWLFFWILIKNKYICTNGIFKAGAQV